jgi:hypothetical protein
MPVVGIYTPRRLNRIKDMIGAKTYLEIGVDTGDTFLAVDVEHKVAVDPSFKFDTAQHATDAVEFFAVTSDEFFVEHAGERRFDLVFIDGLHTFEQALRDFCNALAVGHERTVYVIDDIKPSDVFSALRIPADTMRFRRDSGATMNHAWHGDVYKAMLAIHDFFPMFSYATFATGGNEQSVLWREPRAGFRPRFDDLEAISRLGYFELQEHLDLFNFAAEAEVMARLEDTLARAET